jgi:hypothetical protein
MASFQTDVPASSKFSNGSLKVRIKSSAEQKCCIGRVLAPGRYHIDLRVNWTAIPSTQTPAQPEV